MSLLMARLRRADRSRECLLPGVFRKSRFGAVRTGFDPRAKSAGTSAAMARVVSVPFGRPIWGGYDWPIAGRPRVLQLPPGQAAKEIQKILQQLFHEDRK